MCSAHANFTTKVTWILPLRKKVKGTKFRCRTLAFALCFSRILFIFTLRLYHYIYLNQWIWLAFDIAQQTCKMTQLIEEMSMLPKGPPTHTHTPVISVLMVGLRFLNIPELLALSAWPRIKPLTPLVWKNTLPGDDCWCLALVTLHRPDPDPYLLGHFVVWPWTCRSFPATAPCPCCFLTAPLCTQCSSCFCSLLHWPGSNWSIRCAIKIIVVPGTWCFF